MFHKSGPASSPSRQKKSPSPPFRTSPSPGTRTPRGETPSPPRTKTRTPSPEAPAPYQVYRVEYDGAPNHEAIFVETNEDGATTGHMYHVTGNTLRGMTYEHKRARQPESSATFVAKHRLGTISAADYSAVDGICRSIPVPGAQFTLGGKKLRPNEPIRRCGEWTRDAIHELRARGGLRH